MFGGHKKVFDGMTSFEVYFNPILFANTLVTFNQSSMVRDHNVKLWSSDVTWLRVVVTFFFSLGPRTGSSTSFCLWPSLDICIFLGIGTSVFLLSATVPGFEQIVLAL